MRRRTPASLSLDGIALPSQVRPTLACVAPPHRAPGRSARRGGPSVSPFVYSAGWGQPRQCVVTAGGLSSAGVPRSLCLLPLPLPAGAGSPRVRSSSVRKGRRPGIPWFSGMHSRGGGPVRLSGASPPLQGDFSGRAADLVHRPPAVARMRVRGSTFGGPNTALAMHRHALQGQPPCTTPC